LKKSLLFLLFFAFSILRVEAQNIQQWELYSAYQYTRADTGQAQDALNLITTTNSLPPINIGRHQSLNGWNVSLQENKARWWGGIVDFSGTYGTKNIDLTEIFQKGGLVPPGVTVTERVKPSIYTFAGGPQFTYRRSKIQPFTRIMFGAALSRQGSNLLYDQAIVSSTPAASVTAFALIAGGGADYVWKPFVSFRAAGDLVRTYFANEKQNNIRISIGVNFRIGRL
jgi:hypothetical protein